MTEMIRSSVYGGVAVVLAILAFFISQPRDTEVKEDDVRGKPLFGEFSEATDAAKIRVATYDPEKADARELVIQRKTGRWIIRDMGSYPADNTERVSNAAAAMVAMDVVAMVSNCSGSRSPCSPASDRAFEASCDSV